MNSNNVVLNPQPNGRYIEGVADSSYTVYPGTCVLPVVGGVPDGGARLPWRPWFLSDNQPGLIAISDVDWLQGKIAPNAQDAGRRFPIYVPLPGDELNLRLADVVGSTFTPNIQAGTYLCPQVLTGFLVTIPNSGTAGYNTRPFIAMESVTPVGGTTLQFIRVMVTGY